MKKKLFFVSLAVALIAAGITVGVMFALGTVFDDDDDKEYGKRIRYGQMTGEIAALLDIEEEQLESAIKKAAKERQHKVLQSRLDGMVEKGTLSQEQADAYLDWYKDKPDVPFPGPGLRGFKGRQYAKPDGSSLKRGPESFFFQGPGLRGFEGRQYAKPDGLSLKYGPRAFIIPFGREHFREGTFPEGPPPFFGIEPDGPRFWFRQDGEFLPPAEVICEYMEDAFGERWVEICDDDYYEYYDDDDDDDDYRDGYYDREYKDDD